MADVWVGGEIGVLKGVDLKKSSFTNHSVGENSSRNHEICSMSWNDDNENQILLGSANGIVKTFDVTKKEFVSEWSHPVGKGKLKGLFKWNSAIVSCVDSGLLQIWKDHENSIDIKVGSHVSAVRQNSLCPSQVGTGGQKNDLKLWDLNRPGEPTFRAKNVPNDFLDLQVPIWVCDLGFLPSQGSHSKVVVGTGYHQVRLYDTKAQRRPVLSFDFGESPISALAVTDDENVVIVGNTVGTMGSIDLRKGQLKGHFKGFAGGIRCISCLDKQQMVVSCGLDKFLRVHHLHKRKLLHKIYLKSVLNCLLISAKEIEKQNTKHTDRGDTADLLKRSSERAARGEDSEDEDDDIWDKMEVVTTGSKRKRSEKKTTCAKKKKEKRKAISLVS
ncbi:hypothetical protein pdam_00020103 [Pocillopora damicornis]|uniref:Anaphase-promoting complex subunit 4 WD40 domain-containing protein n=1 Tax=Pocillopora damicornis TaxID=46731 RepID=A0A3M6UXZ1_POCDA|nr:WD repeat-containing protein 74-like [Pocillopora damicornis]RMX58556.1 hypothetical protein pdam_00020103 [Pocillopora damicornis]